MRPTAPPPPNETPPRGLRWGPYGVTVVALSLDEAQASYDDLCAQIRTQRHGAGLRGPIAFSQPYQSGDQVLIDIYSWGP